MALGPASLHQLFERLAADERHVAVQHEHQRVVFHRGQRLLDRMAGTELLRLLDPGDILGLQCLADDLAAGGRKPR